MKEKIEKVISLMKTRPGMMLGNAKSFCAYRHFLEGYFFGLETNNTIKITGELSRFVNKTENGINSSNVYWSSVFDLKYNDHSDEEKIQTLFLLLELFFKEHYIEEQR